jgi:hypothetical protein
MVYADDVHIVTERKIVSTTKKSIKALLGVMKVGGLEVKAEKSMFVCHHQKAGHN